VRIADALGDCADADIAVLADADIAVLDFTAAWSNDRAASLSFTLQPSAAYFFVGKTEQKGPPQPGKCDGH
jgi:hypothetical protein